VMVKRTNPVPGKATAQTKDVPSPDMTNAHPSSQCSEKYCVKVSIGVEASMRSTVISVGVAAF
jgi:hypothetical protein